MLQKLERRSHPHVYIYEGARLYWHLRWMDARSGPLGLGVRLLRWPRQHHGELGSGAIYLIDFLTPFFDFQIGIKSYQTRWLQRPEFRYERFTVHTYTVFQRLRNTQRGIGFRLFYWNPYAWRWCVNLLLPWFDLQLGIREADETRRSG